MATEDELSDSPSESEMLPDEREVIAERVADLDELDAEDFLTVDELANALEIDRD